jgi:translation initiation factor 2 beta subunit (eIF-2beta)/eIF-5
MEEVLQKNFQINYDELLPKEDIISFYSEKYPKLEFWVTIERTGNKYSILNDWTPSVGPLAELVGHYFVLLKKALEYLNEDDKKKSLALLRKIHEMNINSSSVFAAFKYTNMVNKILKEMEEQKTETSNLVFCSKCGKENPVTNNYCTNCGAKLTKNELS